MDALSAASRNSAGRRPNGNGHNVHGVQKRVVEQTRKISTTKTTVTSNKHLGVPFHRGRVLSDTALLPPEKKVKTATAAARAKPPSATGRTPLLDIKVNVPVPAKHVLRKDVQVVRKRLFKSTDVETKHEAETQTYYSKYTEYSNFDDKVSKEPVQIDLRKITNRKNLTPHPKATTIDDCDDELFVDSKQHIIACTPETCEAFLRRRAKSLSSSRTISPIRPNTYTTSSAVIFQGIPNDIRRPAQKTTLMHKLRPGCRERGKAYSLDIYNTEYLEDVVNYQLEKDWKYILKTNILKVHNPGSIQVRAAVVNWLIQAQDFLDLSPTILFATIRLFDNVLENITIPCNMCQLVALVVMWIFSKLEDNVQHLTVSKISALCNGVYAAKQFLKMEHKLLALFNFDLKISDVTIYVAFYTKKLNIDSDLLTHCAHYILECYALNTRFSTVAPSALAAAAICLAIRILHPVSEAWRQLKGIIGYYSEGELDNVKEEMLQQLHKVQDPVYQYRQPYLKYATNEKVQVSVILLRKLIAT